MALLVNHHGWSKLADSFAHQVNSVKIPPPPMHTIVAAAEKLKKFTKINRGTIMENGIPKKPRILCLHGFRTSGEILKKQIGRWPESILRKLDLDFLDAPFPALGKSDVEAFFDPPYYEWYQRNESIAYIEDYMVTHGPFDGLLGFSQLCSVSNLTDEILGSIYSSCFTRDASRGAKFLGFKFGQPKLAVNAFSSPVQCPSLHIIGENDFLKEQGMALLESFVDPVVIYHSKGHTIPRIDERGQETMLSFIQKFQMI
ncbi:alpha/beta-Hydrolases superfamily protein [Citrus sinensis]|nr:alpha/beta-Hydrolases superfamily protein [Citrus sinensis]